MASDMLTVWKRNGEALAKLVSRLKKKLEANIQQSMYAICVSLDVQGLSMHDVCPHMRSSAPPLGLGYGNKTLSNYIHVTFYTRIEIIGLKTSF